MFNEKAQVDLLVSDYLIASHTMDIFLKYSLLHPVQSKNPQEVWGALCGGGLVLLDEGNQMDEATRWMRPSQVQPDG